MNSNTNYVVLSLIVVSLLLAPLVIAEVDSAFSTPSTPSAPVASSESASVSAPSNSGSASSLGLANGPTLSVGGAGGSPLSSAKQACAASATSDTAVCKTPDTVRVPTHNANEEKTQGTPYFCSVSPVYKKLAVAEQTVFQLQCFNVLGSNPDPIPCPSEIQLYSDAGTPTLGELQSVYTRVINFVAGSTTLNGGVLRATMTYPDVVNGGPFSCQANIDVYTKAKSCVLDPQSATLNVDEQKQFSVSCYDGVNPLIQIQGVQDGGVLLRVPCPDFIWTSDAGTMSGGSSTGATLTAKNAGSGKYVEARYIARSAIPEDQFNCRAVVNVNAAPTPTPGGGGGGGTGPGGWNVYYGGGGGSPITPTPTPAAPPAPSPSPNPRPQMGKLVLRVVTPTPSPVTVFAAATPSGLTGLFTAQLAPLALGLFLGIIAVVLLWYWLAGGKKGGEEGAGAAKAAKAKRVEAKPGKASKK